MLASTPARNSALWRHLASGRLLAEGRLQGGTAPFTSTAADVRWVNHSWLADAGFYFIYHFGGGRLLVITKAILIAVLAGLFLQFRRRDSRMGLVVLAACLLLVALGPWLVLQPGLLSLVGVVLTLYLLERPSLVGAGNPDRSEVPSRSSRWLLLPLFAVWANLDAWFLLGPLLVGLYTLGEVLRVLAPPTHSGSASSSREIGPLLILTVAGFAAGLHTPYHYDKFALPAQLGLTATEQILMQDPLGQSLVVSPFSPRFRSSAVFLSPGGWAYFALLAGGALSFALRGRALHPGRLLSWLALAALSAYQSRAIALFAAAAGPILALNLQEWAGTLTATENRRRLLAATRAVGVLILPGLLVLAWPGWLQPAPIEARGWTVEPDESMVRLAESLKLWHPDGTQRSDRLALTISPDAAAYLAWFCPEEKGFLDSRWPLFDDMAGGFVRMRQALLLADGPDPGLVELLKRYQIDRIILYDPDWAQTTATYRCLLAPASEWDLLALEGSAVLFGRQSPVGSPSSWKRYDHRQMAYGQDSRQRSPVSPPAPRRREVFDAFFHRRQDRSPDRAEAALQLMYFDLLSERMRVKVGRTWMSAQTLGLISSAMGCDMAGTAGALAFRIGLITYDPRRSDVPAAPPLLVQSGNQWAVNFLSPRDRGPAESLILAVRAARRSLAADSEDAGAYLILGEAYLRQATQTRQQSWQGLLSSLTDIRRAQVVTALEQAVLLRPDLEEAHVLLAQVYYEEGIMDAALDHARARLRLAQRRTRQAASREGLPAIEEGVTMLEEIVRRSLGIYEANATDRDDPSKVVERARLAARHGLVRKALAMLLESQVAIFGKAGAQLQLELMLRLGRAPEVLAWLESEHEALLGFSTYHWLRTQAEAACGDYAGADQELEHLSDGVRRMNVTAKTALPIRCVVAQRAADAVLSRPSPGAGYAALAGSLFFQFDAFLPLPGAAGLLRQEADLRVLRGLLAVEAGSVEAAREHFHAALDVWGKVDAGGRWIPHDRGAGLEFAARPIAQQLLPFLEEDGRCRGEG
jgi:hypothetical protein